MLQLCSWPAEAVRFSPTVLQIVLLFLAPIFHTRRAATAAVSRHRLAHVLLRLAHPDKDGRATAKIPVLSHQVLAEMVGTTRSRVNLFMNRFRKNGYIDYNGLLEVRKSLRRALTQ